MLFQIWWWLYLDDTQCTIFVMSKLGGSEEISHPYFHFSRSPLLESNTFLYHIQIPIIECIALFSLKSIFFYIQFFTSFSSSCQYVWILNNFQSFTTYHSMYLIVSSFLFQAYELSTLTGTQVMLLVASETGHVYTFATRKLQPMITSDAGKALIQTCLNSPDPPNAPNQPNADQRMSASGYEETELTYNAIADAAAAAAAADAAEQQKVRQMMYNSHHYPLFSPGGAPGTPVSSHAGVQGPPSSHYSQPAPSPSPHQVGGVSTTSGHPPSSSYSPSHHSPPFLGSMGQQARWLAPGEESYSWPTPPSLYPGYGWTKPTLTPSPPPGSVSSRFEDAEEKWGVKSLDRVVIQLFFGKPLISWLCFLLVSTVHHNVNHIVPSLVLD